MHLLPDVVFRGLVTIDQLIVVDDGAKLPMIFGVGYRFSFIKTCIGSIFFTKADNDGTGASVGVIQRE